jgi:hypothetical protein
MNGFTLTTLATLLSANFLIASPSIAESSIKEIRDFEKCIDKSFKEEAKNGKAKVRFLHKKCEPELEALLAFTQQAKAQGLIIPDEDKLSIGPKKRIDTVN